MRNRHFAMLAALLVLLLAGCGGVTEQLAEREVVNYAPQVIGPAESYRADVRGIAPRTVQEVRLVGIAARPDPNLVIDPLILTLRGIQYQRRPFQVTEVAGATFTGRISEAGANEFLRRTGRTTSGKVKNIRVEFQADLVKVTGVYVGPLAVDIPLSTTGRLRATGMHVNFEPVTLVGMGLPDFVKGLVAERVNPLVDLSGLRFDPRIDSIVVAPGSITIGGSARLRNL